MASKRNKRRQSCAGKKQYATQAAAVAAVITLRQQHGVRGLHSYKCPFCKHWHVGHRMKDTWKAMRNRGTA